MAMLFSDTVHKNRLPKPKVNSSGSPPLTTEPGSLWEQVETTEAEHISPDSGHSSVIPYIYIQYEFIYLFIFVPSVTALAVTLDPPF